MWFLAIIVIFLSTRKPSLDVEPTTLATFSSCDRKLWHVALTFKCDLHCKGEPACQISRSKVISFRSCPYSQTGTKTHTYTEQIVLSGPLKLSVIICHIFSRGTGASPPPPWILHWLQHLVDSVRSPQHIINCTFVIKPLMNVCLTFRWMALPAHYWGRELTSSAHLTVAIKVHVITIQVNDWQVGGLMLTLAARL